MPERGLAYRMGEAGPQRVHPCGADWPTELFIRHCLAATDGADAARTETTKINGLHEELDTVLCEVRVRLFGSGFGSGEVLLLHDGQNLGGLCFQATWKMLRCLRC